MSEREGLRDVCLELVEILWLGLDLEGVPRGKAVLQVLRGSETHQLSLAHDSNACCQSVAFLHTIREVRSEKRG